MRESPATVEDAMQYVAEPCATRALKHASRANTSDSPSARAGGALPGVHACSMPYACPSRKRQGSGTWPLGPAAGSGALSQIHPARIAAGPRSGAASPCGEMQCNSVSFNALRVQQHDYCSAAGGHCRQEAECGAPASRGLATISQARRAGRGETHSLKMVRAPRKSEANQPSSGVVGGVSPREGN